MRSIPAFLLLAIAWGCHFPRLDAGVQAEIFVAPDGDDGNPGTLARPFATIEKARQAVRAINTSMSGDIYVYLRAGTYYLTGTVTFSDADSGTNGYKVYYRNYDASGSAKFLGGTRLNEWTLHSGSIYKTPVGASFGFDTLYENDARSTLARTPNSGYLKSVSGSASALRFNSGEIPQIHNVSFVHICSWLDGNDWDNDHVGVSGIDYSSQSVYLKRSANGQISSGSRYFIEGALELLDQAGEFYLDKGAGWLYYWPRALPIASQVVIAPILSTMVGFKGSSSGSPVHDIHFQGLVFAASNFNFDEKENNIWTYGENGIFCMENARNITIASCRILNAGVNAISLKGWAQNNTIYGNEISDVGYSGIKIQGASQPTLSLNSKSNIVSNNRIQNVGQIHFGYIGGVYIQYSGYNTIAHNEISCSPRYGISLKGMAYSYMQSSYDGVGVTYANRKDFIPTRNNDVAFNDVSRCNLDSQDSGAIEGWGFGRDNVINNNRVHDNGSFKGQFGIYLDDDASYAIVKNNIVYGMLGGSTSYPAFIKGVQNVVSNNIFDSSGMTGGFYSLEYGNDKSNNLFLSKNIFYNRDAGNLLYKFHNWNTGGILRLASCDDNLFHQASGGYDVWINGYATSLSAWRSSYGYDRNSLSADPLFENAAGHDYRLKAGSPAFNLGFQPLDHNSIGLQADYLKSDAVAASNQAPVVNAGADKSVTLPERASLGGSASDDGLPPGRALTYAWSMVSGAGTVSFTSAASSDTTASFTASGTYVLRLSASDGALSSSDDVQVVVHPAPAVSPAPITKTETVTAVAALQPSAVPMLASNETGLLVPAYPTDPATWDRIAKGAAKVKLIAIANLLNGPTGWAPPTYLSSLQSVVAVGGLVIGYVDTNYAKRSLQAVKADIDIWFANFPAVKGVFLDQASYVSGAELYYKEIYAYVQSKRPGAAVVTNPGTNTIYDYLYQPYPERIADVINIFESPVSSAMYTSWTPPVWVQTAGRQNFAGMVYAVAQGSMTQVVNNIVQKGLGWIYVTDGGGGFESGAWGVLPSYWEALVDALALRAGDRPPVANAGADFTVTLPSGTSPMSTVAVSQAPVANSGTETEHPLETAASNAATGADLTVTPPSATSFLSAAALSQAPVANSGTDTQQPLETAAGNATPDTDHDGASNNQEFLQGLNRTVVALDASAGTSSVGRVENAVTGGPVGATAPAVAAAIPPAPSGGGCLLKDLPVPGWFPVPLGLGAGDPPAPGRFYPWNSVIRP